MSTPDEERVARELIQAVRQNRQVRIVGQGVQVQTGNAGLVDLGVGQPVEVRRQIVRDRRRRGQDVAVRVCAPLPISPCGTNRLLTNGALSLLINNESGAISQVLFGGADWYRPIAAVSDLAIMVDDFFDLITAASDNDPDGVFSFFETTATSSVCGDSSRVVSSDYEGEIDYSKFPLFREYEAFSENAFKVNTYMANKSGSSVTIKLAETFDPDQDFDVAGETLTRNSIRTIDGTRVAQARGAITDRTVIMGSPDEGALIESGDSGNYAVFQIFNDRQLEFFTSSPQVAEGPESAIDLGIHCGIERIVPPGGCFRFTMIQAFGLTVGEAEEAWAAAISSVS